jgi:N-acetylglucosamine kinase-like BadF-type ATPase
MIILVESGATKSDWRLLAGDGSEVRRELFPGMNVSTVSMEHNLETLTNALEAFGRPSLDGFYLYTAGIVTPEVRQTLEGRIRELIQVGEIDINDDLVAAARAVCGREKGIVAIIGTGSNTCFYDGATVSQKVRSGGYIIGDEGGGAVLGKLFLADFIKGLIPQDVADDFAGKFDASYMGIVQNVYRSAAPAGFLGSLAPFILSHYDNPYIKGLVDGNFRSFIVRALKKYDTATYPVGVVGGLAYACKDIFIRICEEEGVKVGGFLPEPISGLIKYHTAL